MLTLQFKVLVKLKMQLTFTYFITSTYLHSWGKQRTKFPQATQAARNNRTILISKFSSNIMAVLLYLTSVNQNEFLTNYDLMKYFIITFKCKEVC